MKYSPIDPSLFQLNRERFTALTPKNSISIFNSNDILPTNADGVLPFRQNNDLFYLSGIDQEETILLLYPDATKVADKAILFIKETSELIAIWEGHKLTKEGAKNVSGIQSVYWLTEFESILDRLITSTDQVLLNANEHKRASKKVETRDDRFRKWIQAAYPLHQYSRLAPIMHELRVVKSKGEIDLMKHACSITEKAFKKVLQTTTSNSYEYEIQATIQYEFLKNRANGPAYQSIVASGKDACVLHYIENSKQCKDGDLILMDFGAEYANYASDMTRTIPANGKFTKRQKQVYNEVLFVMKYATTLLVVGNTFEKYNKEVNQVMEEALIRLGLITQEEIDAQNANIPVRRKYFMHGISHFIGLDTHDVGDYSIPFKEGMVLTCEPGIYIQEENIGIRLENNILITKDGPVDLMKSIPLEIDEIEKWMRDK
ncbi:MAG: aminopeptidase P N-terminal domain-containing protein [Cyclobacteriaceae bacterium]